MTVMLTKLRRVHAIAAVGLAALCGASACSALIGIKNITDAPSDEADGGGLSDGSASDASPSDAIADGGGACNADLSHDPKNCGRCGHDCLKGDCDGGRCTPVAVSSSEVDLEELRVAGDRLLYRANQHVAAVPVDGGLPTVLVSCANRSGLAVTDAGFYSWCNGSLTLRDVLDAGIRADTVIDGFRAAAAGDWMFFCQNTSELDRIPATLPDGGWTQVNGLTGGYQSLATNSSELFYMTQHGSLFHVAFASGSGTELEQNQPAPGEIAVDDTAVFWVAATDTDQGVLRGRPFAAGQSTVLATGLNRPDGVAIDERYVYVTLRGTPPAYTDGAIVRVPREGGAVEPMVEGVVLPHAIAVTDSLVIFTSRGTLDDAGGTSGGAIYRVAK